MRISQTTTTTLCKAISAQQSVWKSGPKARSEEEEEENENESIVRAEGRERT